MRFISATYIIFIKHIMIKIGPNMEMEEVTSEVKFE